MSQPPSPLPRNPYDLSDELVSLTADHIERAGHCVLFVDDEPDQLASLRALFGRLYDVETAGGANEALLILQSRETDPTKAPVCALLSDQRMPGIGGAELLSQVRQRYPMTVRLLITAYADIKAVISAINEGQVHRYVSKTCDPEELADVIRKSVALSILMRRMAARRKTKP